MEAIALRLEAIACRLEAIALLCSHVLNPKYLKTKPSKLIAHPALSAFDFAVSFQFFSALRL